MKDRVPDPTSERRLEQLREEALRLGRVQGTGVHPSGAPMPDTRPGTSGPETPAPATPLGARGSTSGRDLNYYGLPLLKPPVWTWEVPLYFFVGGAAGASAVVALAAQFSGADKDLVRDARWLACIGATLSGPLLVADLGRPKRFLNMLRVFKPQSAMSVGVWTLTLFAGASALAAVAQRRFRLVGDLAAIAAAASGLGMATYTGVLLGATSIPVWSKHVKRLPIHFAASGLASSVSILQLRGHDEPALNLLGIAAAAFETWIGVRIEADPTSVSDPLRVGMTGTTTRLGGLFSGPLPLALRLIGLRSKRARRAAAVASIVGSIVTRFAWVEAGKVSAKDPRVLGEDQLATQSVPDSQSGSERRDGRAAMANPTPSVSKDR
ncbi:MAG: NrfD/PsrC family molybdoenzyme membrane anchor subunit [Acidobacteriota bacterium]